VGVYHYNFLATFSENAPRPETSKKVTFRKSGFSLRKGTHFAGPMREKGGLEVAKTHFFAQSQNCFVS